MSFDVFIVFFLFFSWGVPNDDDNCVPQFFPVPVVKIGWDESRIRIAG